MKVKRNKSWLSAEKVCIAYGHASALNLMFEKKRDHQRFFDLWNKYLGNMAELIQYHLAPTGWTLLFKTKTKKEIISAYHEQRRKSNKVQEKCELSKVEKIISEHFRIFLSQYARRTNADNGRKGTLVLERFSKGIFKEGADFLRVFEQITQRLHQKVQEKRYQADEARYDIEGEMKNDSLWKVGKVRLFEMGYGEFLCVGESNPYTYVLRNSTKFINIPKSQPPDS